MICTHSNQCDLYVQFAAEPALALWKERYCNGRYNECARFQCAARNQIVPMTLLPNGAQLGQARNTHDITLNAIFNAISKNRCHMVQSIIKASPGAQHDVNSDGISPLMFAAKLGNVEMIKLLLAFKCNPSLRNKKGMTALAIAIQCGYENCASILRKAERQSISTVPRRQGSIIRTNTDKESLLSRMLHFLRGKNRHPQTTRRR